MNARLRNNRNAASRAFWRKFSQADLSRLAEPPPPVKNISQLVAIDATEFHDLEPPSTIWACPTCLCSYHPPRPEPDCLCNIHWNENRLKFPHYAIQITYQELERRRTGRAYSLTRHLTQQQPGNLAPQDPGLGGPS